MIEIVEYQDYSGFIHFVPQLWGGIPQPIGWALLGLTIAIIPLFISFRKK